MSGFIRTVLGDVLPEEIGKALMHEHILFDIVSPDNTGDRDTPINPENRWQMDYLSNADASNAHQTDVTVATNELRAFRRDGGSLIVDQSVEGLKRDPNGLASASKESGVHVVCAAGTYTMRYLSNSLAELSVDELANRFEQDIMVGIGDTGIRAGLIGEIGCSWPIEQVERRALKAAAMAQTRTGATISVHPGIHPTACNEILDLLESAGADFSRVILCHMDRTFPTGDGIEALLKRGVNVEWDFFGIEQSHYWMGDVVLPTDIQRLRLIERFADAGYARQILISHDICTRTRMMTWGGHGYGHILRNIPALMSRLGLGAELKEALLRGNPLRLLTMEDSIHA